MFCILTKISGFLVAWRMANLVSVGYNTSASTDFLFSSARSPRRDRSVCAIPLYIPNHKIITITRKLRLFFISFGFIKVLNSSSTHYKGVIVIEVNPTTGINQFMEFYCGLTVLLLLIKSLLFLLLHFFKIPSEQKIMLQGLHVQFQSFCTFFYITERMP